MTVTPITKLELRSVLIPCSPTIARLEQESGRPLTHETRPYLAGRPVYRGDILELQFDGDWIIGRYEWTGKPEERPTFEYDAGIMRIDDECLVRWPD